ncbi:hypothetical protein QH494_06415 [Sphingomonas sp. AR_OL41]|uniref:hypothetical protein n=1 Tax=Sphingomonas sp. AR_OL41 TaxID=3042729 RepID=UPI00247FE8EE|nr:hypothetical protein [Sphingomonas sp. AR_OL41]MDH7971813.1 hypothetical protein [Sphingomonas sp. AR_OL41]
MALAAMVACALLPGAVSADDTSQPPIKIARQSPQLAYVNAAPRGTRTYQRGEIIMIAPLMWEIGARLPQETTIRAGEDSKTIRAGSVLQGVMLTELAAHRDEMAYCTPRVAAERKADGGMLGAMLGGGSLWRSVIRSATDGQFCLIDSDDDGMADHSVELNAGSPAARTPVAIAPVRLERDRMIPISSNDDRIEISVSDVSSKGKAARFRIDVFQQGKGRVFDTIGDTQRITWVDAKRGLPVHAMIYQTQFDVVSIDGAARTVTVRWPEDVDAKEVVPITDGLRVVLR